MDTLPEFVTDEKETGAAPAPKPLTGWETVIFQVDDEPGPDFSTAATRP